MNELESNLLVLASAGSGKTFRLSDRIISLIARGVEPEKIVALTFTRKAAGEFADAILAKLAEAAEDPNRADTLCTAIGVEGVDFTELLEKLLPKLPRLMLGTMDKFFTRIVKAFQFELGVTGGKFELLEGEAGQALRDRLLEDLLDGELGPKEQEQFIAGFRHATAGKEGTTVIKELRDFINIWHKLYISPNKLKWGLESLAGVEVSEWYQQREPLISQIRRDVPNLVFTDKRQGAALEKILEQLSNYVIASGGLSTDSLLFKGIITAITHNGDAMDVALYKPFQITGMAAQGMRKLITLAARCELAAALARTRGIEGVIARYDVLVDRELRKKGRLGFDDVKLLMGSWMHGEDARLRREAIDFRLDANYSHWLLDEFQDTSREDWHAIRPLIDEGLTDNESTVFIVGDKKQAIYAWRGGDVGLFDEVIEEYSGGLNVDTMAESWRSCPEVLELVNQVCGDQQTMAQLFGETAARWQWEAHVPASPLVNPEKSGHTQVEILPKGEDAIERAIELFHQLHIGEKQLSCAVLVAKNKDVTEWAEALRAASFQVVEEGARTPAEDHPVGLMVWQLLRWLANPADAFAQHTVMMSPLGPGLSATFGPSWQAIWERLGGLVSEKGFAGMATQLISPLLGGWEEFGKRRATEMINALAQIDLEGIMTAKEAADRIEKLKISQSPGVAAIQVMTIHKSKGLGFDVVLIPDISSSVVPDLTNFKTILSDGWVTDSPVSWARTLIPEIAAAQARWADDQIYEAFCKLYVAMTRAKRGLYIFLKTPAASHSQDKASLANWVMHSLGLDGEETTIFETGSITWVDRVPEISEKALHTSLPLGLAAQKRSRSTPTGQKSGGKNRVSVNAEGVRFGSEVHRAFESVGWLDEGPAPAFPEKIAATMQGVLAAPEVAGLLSRKNRDIGLFREQRVEAILGETWISGVIDRLHVHYGENREPVLVEVIDFKTDRVERVEDLSQRYAAQMQAYQNTISTIYPTAKVTTILLSTALKTLVREDV